jgi:UDP-N-acetylmuramate--alanine ligase
VQTPFGIIENLRFNLPGRHNLSNALLAIAMAVEYGVSHKQLAKALDTFKGVKRRFSVHYNTEKMVYIDDYAHHPEEINALHSALREMYPDRKILAIFQPHLFSRTRDFSKEFASSLAQFDALLLLDIYPARELPIQGVTSKWLLGKITSEDKKLIEKKDILSEIKKSEATLIVTIGAGDIGAEVKHIKEAIEFAY